MGKLYLIGLGLGSFEDITLKGMNAIRESDFLYLEFYTSILGNVSQQQLEEFYQKKIELADREFVEEKAQIMLDQCKQGKSVGFLVVGDPLCATTHIDLFLRAREQNIEVQVIHNASIMNAIAITGLQLYRFGETVTVPFFSENWKPYSFFEKIVVNLKNQQHTLVLLDIKLRELDINFLMQGKRKYEEPRIMTADIAAAEILEAAQAYYQSKAQQQQQNQQCQSAINENQSTQNQLPVQAEEQKQEIQQIENKQQEQKELQKLEDWQNKEIVVVERLGSKDQQIQVGTLLNFANQGISLGPTLHSLVIPAQELHPLEIDMIQFYRSQTKVV